MAYSEGTVTNIQRRPEYIETLDKGILDYLFGYDPESGTYSGILGPLGKEKGYFDLPDYQVAPYTDIQKTLLDYVGSEGFQDRYKDYIDTGEAAIDKGIGFFDKASDLEKITRKTREDVSNIRDVKGAIKAIPDAVRTYRGVKQAINA